MNPFRLTEADIMEISGVAYRLWEVLDEGYLLLQENSDVAKHHPYEYLLRQWVSGGINLKYSERGDSQ